MLDKAYLHFQKEANWKQKAQTTAMSDKVFFNTRDALETHKKPKIIAAKFDPLADTEIQRHEKGVTISWRWFKRTKLKQLVYSSIYCIVLGCILVALNPPQGLQAIAISFSCISLLLAIIYQNLCIIFNRSWINISDQKITFDTKPIPTINAPREFYTDEIEDVFIKLETSRDRYDKLYVHYHLYILRQNQNKPELFLNDSDPQFLNLLEKELKDYLGIVESSMKHTSY